MNQDQRIILIVLLISSVFFGFVVINIDRAVSWYMLSEYDEYYISNLPATEGRLYLIRGDVVDVNLSKGYFNITDGTGDLTVFPDSLCNCKSILDINPHNVTVAGYFVGQGAYIDLSDNNGFSSNESIIITQYDSVERIKYEYYKFMARRVIKVS